MLRGRRVARARAGVRVGWVACWLLLCCVVGRAEQGMRAPVHKGRQTSSQDEDGPAPTCASCHAPFADPQPRSGMGRALIPPNANQALSAHPELTLTSGAYTYTVRTRNGESTYSVTDGQRTISVPVLWSFGANNQTWMLALNGKMYESLVSYYVDVKGLAITTGDDRIHPTTVEQALGRELTTMDVKTCFGCHATNSLGTSPAGRAGPGAETGVAGPGGATNLPRQDHAAAAPLAATAASPGQRPLPVRSEVRGQGTDFRELMSNPAVLATASLGGMPDLKTLQPGVTCEHCHLRAAAHLLDASNGHFESTPPSLGKMTSEDMSNFCGKCHRTWDMVVRSRWRGEMNVRFQPYRLANSACYNGADARIGCTACHNPHEDVVRDAAYYDGKCLACHTVDAHVAEGGAAHRVNAALAGVQGEVAGGGPGKAQGGGPAKACPVAKSNCTTCHMPKVVLPNSGGHLT
ncbi:MAG TPA: hypothetical protein VGD62_03620, partial [Acidobacteriaceae bacterium]